MSNNWFTKPIKGILLDISGVLKDSDTAIHGSVLGLEMLQTLGIPYRLLTNETTETKKNLVILLRKLGFRVDEKDIISPIPIVVDMLRREDLRPYLLVHEEVVEEFIGVNKDEENCVVIADAGPNFTYRNLNQAFRILMEIPEPRLYCLGMGKYYKGEEGLNLDVGTFAKALEFATGVKGTIIGKPSPEYFMFAVKEMGLDPKDVVMIGDDLESDVIGAQSCGIRGVLVKTGKFRASDLDRATSIADGVVDNMYEAVELICKYCSQQDFSKDVLS